ncbi:MAG: hypothetical protein H7125_14015 [Proteobacteria bacterium]|nr:hypothetical protein [Burkholderiales bacterium]
MADSTDQTKEFFDWMRRMWTPEAYGLPGMAAMSATSPMPSFPGLPALFTPTADPKELERRIVELQTVENWLKMNVGLIQMTVKTLELQKSALESIKQMNPDPRPQK